MNRNLTATIALATGLGIAGVAHAQSTQAPDQQPTAAPQMAPTQSPASPAGTGNPNLQNGSFQSAPQGTAMTTPQPGMQGQPAAQPGMQSGMRADSQGMTNGMQAGTQQGVPAAQANVQGSAGTQDDQTTRQHQAELQRMISSSGGGRMGRAHRRVLQAQPVSETRGINNKQQTPAMQQPHSGSVNAGGTMQQPMPGTSSSGTTPGMSQTH